MDKIERDARFTYSVGNPSCITYTIMRDDLSEGVSVAIRTGTPLRDLLEGAVAMCQAHRQHLARREFPIPDYNQHKWEFTFHR